ncbi:aspartate aminotransferase family protein [Longibacter salinarum]|uniref:Aspartate aminotransferase family protein n=1 Tax=Longibacter salinarum TaxID=1850348 RepID=A0A2A8CZI6_9BACT|nr:aminotransferase class V-fold PLP-dependent enzyme [Longibacter salinarum]PEN14044.1 aspartate aminotransferase family protein [Longibacter salinarum]
MSGNTSSPFSLSTTTSTQPALNELISEAVGAIQEWSDGWGPYEAHPSTIVDGAGLRSALGEFTDRMSGNYPFGHPRYAGQMLKPPHPVAIAAYAAAMCVNPNNHALDGGPPTSEMEKEVIEDLADMLGFPAESLGHLTAGGTIANLEALWVAREEHPNQTIAFSADAHYTHGRMCGVLDVNPVVIPTDNHGRMRLEKLEEILAKQDVGTVVVTAGTTGLGTVDPIADVVDRCREAGVRVHVDAAYGGFFRLLANGDSESFDGFPARHFLAIEDAESVAIDPHKHGLQPYGCGAVLFRDPSVGRFYKHDSPYTYFTSDDLHLGEISLECSRAGAAAGALWTTLRALPLEPSDGLGAILAACMRAARTWADTIDASAAFELYTAPETDIVSYIPVPRESSLSALDAASRAVFDAAMNHEEEPVFLSLYRLSAERLSARFPHLTADREDAAILRSVLMKPEHETYAADIVDHLSTIARGVV